LADELGAAYYDLDPERDAGRLILPGDTTLDFTRLRGESIEADLQGRDFTVNAIAVELARHPELIDPTGGVQDLRAGILRACSDQALEQDPIRALRAPRLAVELGMRIEPDTLRWVRESAPFLHRASAERRRDEFFRILDLQHPARALRLIDRLGLLTALLPELEPLRDLEQPPPHSMKALAHTLAVIARLRELLSVLGEAFDPERAADLILAEAAYRLGRFRRDLREYLGRPISYGRSLRQLLYFGALFHEAGKPGAAVREGGRIGFSGHEQVGAEVIRRRSRNLRLSRGEVDWLTTLVRHHMRPAWLASEPKVSPKAIYRFFRDTGDAAEGVLLLSLADFLGKSHNPPPQEAWRDRVQLVREMLHARYEAGPHVLNPPPLLRGDELAEALDLLPGPRIGDLLESIREAQVSGAVRTKAEALEHARRTAQGWNRGSEEAAANGV
jgi:tRNA nucleotidyltransferase/poly(A) polymerase